MKKTTEFFFSEIKTSQRKKGGHSFSLSNRGALSFFTLLSSFFLVLLLRRDVERSRAARCHGRSHAVGVELAEESDGNIDASAAAAAAASADGNAVGGGGGGIACLFESRQRRRQRLRQGLVVLRGVDVDRLQGKPDSRRARRTRRERRRQGRGDVVEQLLFILARRKRRRRRSRRPRSRPRRRQRRQRSNDSSAAAAVFSSSNKQQAEAGSRLFSCLRKGRRQGLARQAPTGRQPRRLPQPPESAAQTNLAPSPEPAKN